MCVVLELCHVYYKTARPLGVFVTLVAIKCEKLETRLNKISVRIEFAKEPSSSDLFLNVFIGIFFSIPCFISGQCYFGRIYVSIYFRKRYLYNLLMLLIFNLYREC